MATTNKQSTGVLNVTGTGSSVSEVLAGLVSDLTAGLQGNTQLAAQFAQLATVNQTQTDAVIQNTQAVLGNTAAQASSGSGSAVKSAGSTLGKILGSGLGLSPLLTGLVSLFTGGGSTSTPPALVKYTPPPSINFAGSITGSEAEAPLLRSSPLAPADYEGSSARSEAAAAPLLRYTPLASADYEGSIARSEAAAAPLLRYTPLASADYEGSSARSEAAAAQEPGSGAGTRAIAPQITIQVQAMDSRSFLDHSDQIAQAVRQAMLNSHSLNDVVNDL
ncbi:MAG: hypothetical protein ABSE56_02170 [Bryobacteraceae bacterium]